MAGNHLAAGDAAAALGGAFPGGKPAEEALVLGLGNQAIAAGAALPRRLGVQHVQPAEIDLVLGADRLGRSEEDTSELQTLISNPYAVFCLKKTKRSNYQHLCLLSIPNSPINT